MEPEVATAKLKILIKLANGKQQEFTMTGLVHNTEINLGTVMFSIETAINNANLNIRAHTDIE